MACAAAALTLAVALLAWSDYRDTVAAARADLQRTVQIVEQHTRMLTAVANLQLDALIRAVGQDPPAVAAARPDTAALMQALLPQLPAGHSLWLYDRDGTVVLNSLGRPDIPRAADREFFQAAMQRPGLQIGRMLLARADGSMATVFSKRIPASDGGVAGIVSTAVRASGVNAFYSGLGQDRLLITVARDDGSIVARSTLPASEPPPGIVAGVIREIDQPVGFINGASPVDQVDRLSAYRRLPDLGLTVFASLPWSAITEGFYARLPWIIGIGSACLMLIIALAAIADDRMGAEAASAQKAREHERELMVARAAAEQASAQKTEFLAAISHDLRQPVQALVLLLDQLRGRVTGDAVEPARQARQAVGGLSQMLGNLLDLAQLDAGAVEPKVADLPVAPLFAALVDEFAPLAEAKGLRLEAPASPAWIRSDPILLKRILGNLVSNAIKYTEKGSIRLDCRHEGGDLLLSVADTGIGIPPEHHAAVFDAFRQLGNPNRDRRLGHGLGLATVRRLCALLDHPISLRSRPGEGTVFTLKVPIGAVMQERAPEPAASPAGTGRVLIVEDDPLVGELLTTALADAGFTVELAETLQGARRRLHEAPSFEYVLTDFNLPDGIGTDVLRTARAASPQTALVALTGDVTCELPPDLRAVGARLIHKPLRLDALVQTLLSMRSPHPA